MIKQHQLLSFQEKQLIEAEAEVTKMDKSYWKYNDYSTFVVINRNQEDKNVIRFQKTGDVNIFEDLYCTRISTLQIWAHKYYYLMDSQEDMFGELSLYFTKAIFKYKKLRGSFNTCLYTFLLNCIRNLRMGKKAKKRKPRNADPNSIANFTLSLDYNYNNKGDSENTLKDIIAIEMKDDINIVESVCLEETMNVLSEQHPNIKGFLRRLSDGHSLSALLKEYKTKKGKIKISRFQIKQLDIKRRCNKIVSNIIKDKKNIDDGFDVVNYRIVNPNKLYYTIEMIKTKESDFILKTIRNLRRDKNVLLNKIKG